MKWVALVLAVTACSDQRTLDVDIGPSDDGEAPIAVVIFSPAHVQLAVAGESQRAGLADVLAGARPTTFRWTMITLDAALGAQLASGVTFDLAVPGTARFEQVYVGVCNPARQNFDPCLLHEELVAGAPGVRGTFSLQLGDRLRGSYDVYGEGLTNRFGEPLQWHGHGTSGGVDAPRVP